MRIVFVAARYPWPSRRGDQLRAQQFLDTLVAAGGDLADPPRGSRAQVDLLVPAPSEHSTSRTPEGVEEHIYRRDARDFVAGVVRAGLGGGSLQTSFFYSRDLLRRLKPLVVEADLVITQLARLAPQVLAVCGHPLRPVYVDLIDALSLNFERRAVLDRRPLAPLWRLEARRLASAEERIVRTAACASLVCERDRAHLARRLEERCLERLDVVPLPTVVTGPAPSRVALTVEPPTLMMTGNLGYFVNRDAVVWWLRSVWPMLRDSRAELRLVVAGSRASGSLAREIEESGATLVRNPQDLRSLLRGASVALAPLRAGAGVPVKVLEAWAEGVPVVASGWAAAGAGGVDGEDLLVAESPREWSSKIEQLLDEPTTAARLAEAGRQRVSEDHSTEHCREALISSLRRAVAARAGLVH